MVETLLIATDGSDAAQVAERYGVALAQKLRAGVLGLSVVEEDRAQSLRAPALGIADGPVAAVEQFLHARAAAAVQRLAGLARRQQLECDAEVLRGAADERIVERLRRADLLVIGRDGEHAKRRNPLLGSTATGVLLKTRKSVVVTPATANFDGPLLLAFDGSPGARIAARMTLELARRLERPVFAFVDSKDRSRTQARFEQLHRLMANLPTKLHEIPATLGRPDVKILEAAQDARAGLIVMGAFGRNRISEYFLGSNATAVVRSSPVAVLLAR